jgi:hypothetical protein
MTSALQGSWADDGLKGLLGRKWPTGRGLAGPNGGSPLSRPDLLVQASFTRWASTAARWAGCHMRPSGLLPSRFQERGSCPFPRRTPRPAATALAHAPAAARRCGPGHGAGVRFCCASTLLWTHTHARTHARLEGRLTAHPPRRAARRRGPARVQLHGAAKAMARWGAAG